MNFFAKSDIGTKREENQDSYGISEKGGEYLLSVVCDGMGGMAGGKTAAKLAVKTFLSRFGFFYAERREATDEVKPFDIKRIFSNAVFSANKAIFEEAENDESLFGMGATLTSALIYKSRLYTSNVGDSRIYLIRGEEISQLTKDNSYVQELLDQGIIDEESARTHPRRNLITKALGASSEIEPEYTATDLEDGDYILLCTDGLTNALPDEKIKEIIKKATALEEKVTELITCANEKSGDDNVTALLIKI